MATIGHAFAALVMKLSNRLSLQPSDFLAFPSFQTRLSLDQVEHVSSPEKLDTTDGAAARKRALSIEAFSRLVNHIPTGKLDFVLSGQPLWDIYQQTLLNAETATNPEAEAVRAIVEFKNRNDAMMFNQRPSVSGISDTYWPVGVDPIVDLRDPQSWTRITLDQKAIEDTVKKIPKDLEEWLQARDLMRPLETAGVRGLAIEACYFSIRRNWFDQNVFNSTNWRMRDSSMLSDGGNPPAGLLPAIVQGVVLIRKLEVELEPVTGGELASLVTQPGNPSKLLTTSLLLKNTFVMAPIRPLESFAKKPRPGMAMAKDMTAAETATSGFPSPVFIKSQLVIDQLEKNMAAVSLELEKAGQRLATLRSGLATSEAQAAEIQKTLQRPPPNASEPIIREHRHRDAALESASSSAMLKVFSHQAAKKASKKAAKKAASKRPAVKSTTIDLKPLRARLATITNRINALKAEILNAEANQRSLNEKLNKLRDEKAGYEKLATDPFGADEVFLFAAVCRRTPKSPNPTPNLFST
jgi:hypothetical protein